MRSRCIAAKETQETLSLREMREEKGRVGDSSIEMVAKMLDTFISDGFGLQMGWLSKGRERSVDGGKCQGHRPFKFECHNTSGRILPKKPD